MSKRIGGDGGGEIMRVIIVKNQSDWDALPVGFEELTEVHICCDPAHLLIIKKCPESSRVVALESSRAAAFGASRVEARDFSRIDAWGDSQVEARDSSRVAAFGNSRVVAMDSSRVKARESALVEAMGACQVDAFGASHVVAQGASRVEAFESSRVDAQESSQVVARDSSRIVARGDSRVKAFESSRVDAWGDSQVEAFDSSQVEARESSQVEARGSSRVVARGASRVEARNSSRVDAWEDSRVMARGSSRVVAWGSSQVEARESTLVEAMGSCRVVAWENAIVRVLSTGVAVDAWHHATIICQDCSPTIETHGTGVTIARTETFRHSKESFAEIYKPKGTKVTLYKAVRPHNRTDYHSGMIRYEGIVECPDWNPDDGIECGNGLHLSPTIGDLRQWQQDGLILECEADMEDISVYPGDISKVRCRKVRVIGEATV